MSNYPWKQYFPNPDLDPGFRVDPRGRARFQVEGYTVDVQVVYTDGDSDEVEMTASITLNGLKIAEASGRAEWGEYYILRDVLDGLLTEVVKDARHAVQTLAARVAVIEKSEAAR